MTNSIKDDAINWESYTGWTSKHLLPDPKMRKSSGFLT
jgi:hypothetical protein